MNHEKSIEDFLARCDSKLAERQKERDEEKPVFRPYVADQYFDIKEVRDDAERVMRAIQRAESQRVDTTAQDVIDRDADVRVLRKDNIAYLCIYLRNAGERLRAIMLAADVFNLNVKQAKEWVDTVTYVREKIDNSKARKTFAEYPTDLIEEVTLEDSYEIKVSHFPSESDVLLRMANVPSEGVPPAATSQFTRKAGDGTPNVLDLIRAKGATPQPVEPAASGTPEGPFRCEKHNRNAEFFGYVGFDTTTGQAGEDWRCPTCEWFRLNAEVDDLEQRLRASEAERKRYERKFGKNMETSQQIIDQLRAEVARLTKERDTYTQQVDAQCGFMANIADTLRVRGFTAPKPLDERVIALAQDRDALASQVAELQRDAAMRAKGEA